LKSTTIILIKERKKKKESSQNCNVLLESNNCKKF
jgi:hypothetical protein